MLCDEDDYKKKVMANIYDVFNQDLLPKTHVNFLENVLYYVSFFIILFLTIIRDKFKISSRNSKKVKKLAPKNHGLCRNAM